MIIRNLRLTNIKSYKDGRFTFEEGTLLGGSGRRISSVGAAGLPDIYEEARYDLKLVMAKKLGSNMTVKLTLENLLLQNFQDLLPTLLVSLASALLYGLTVLDLTLLLVLLLILGRNIVRALMERRDE